jgi:hypothetical protein
MCLFPERNQDRRKLFETPRHGFDFVPVGRELLHVLIARDRTQRFAAADQPSEFIDQRHPDLVERADKIVGAAHHLTDLAAIVRESEELRDQSDDAR